MQSIVWYVAFFITLIVIVVLGITERADFSKYIELANYIAIFQITLAVELFSYFNGI